MNRTLPLALIGLLALSSGCASFSPHATQPERNRFADRSSYIDRRSQELIQRGVPKEAALSKASGEWFSQQTAEEQRAEDNQRSEQRLLERKLAEMSRNRADGR